MTTKVDSYEEITTFISQAVVLTIRVPRGFSAETKVKALAKNYGIKGSVQRINIVKIRPDLPRNVEDVCSSSLNDESTLIVGIKIVCEATHHKCLAVFVIGIRMTFKPYELVDLSFIERTNSQNFKVIKSVNICSDDDYSFPNIGLIPPNGKTWLVTDAFLERCEILSSPDNPKVEINEKDRLVLTSLKKEGKSKIHQKLIEELNEEMLIAFLKKEHESSRLKIKGECFEKLTNYLKEEEYNGTSLMFITLDELKNCLLDIGLKSGCVLSICSFVDKLKKSNKTTIALFYLV